MRAFTLRWVDAAAGLAWVAATVLACGGALGADALRPWVALLAAVGALTTAIAWLSRRLEQLESHVYTEGMRAGFEARQVVRLPDQRS